MKTFTEWKKIREGLSDFMPNMGQRAIPVNQGQPQQGQQVSLSTLASKVRNPDWHQLHDVFARQFQKMPNDTGTKQLGQALAQAAQTNNMMGLQPFKQKYLYAQKV